VAVLPTSLDYTDKDFDALRARLIALVKSVFPDWSDFSVASFGNLLIEMYAFVGDVVTFYLHNQARESRLSTATQRKNVIALARMLAYRLHGAQAATAEVLVKLARPPSADVIIPAGMVVRTQEVTEPVRFQLLADLTIPAGADPPEALCVVESSETRTQLFDSWGLADLDILLDYTPYLDGSAVVSAANGDYVEKDSLLGSEPNDRHFMVLVDQNDRATIRFGNGTSGAPPTGTVRITYKTGGGAGGNVDAGRLVVIKGAFTDVHGHPVQVSVQSPVYRNVDIEARIYLRQGHAKSTVRDRVKANLQAMFRVSEPDGTPNPLVDFGFNIKDADGNPVGEIAWSDVFDVIRDTTGVRKVGDRHGDLKLNGLPADVRLGIKEFPLLGNVTLIDGDTGSFL
jgi:hypothetical protein